MTESLPLILVINSGSSSLKFAIHAEGRRAPLLSGLAERLGLTGATIRLKDADGATTLPLPEASHAAALDAVLAALDARGWRERLIAVGHRLVHGGERITRSTRVTPAVVEDIAACVPLAPLHNPAALSGLRSAMERLPHVSHVVVPDTAFHQTMPPSAYLYAIPTEFYRDHGVRRYGFHGTSHRFVAGRAVEMLKLDPEDHGIVTAHLGNGASATAVQDGQSLDTTMGMTPLEGLVMGTRSGDIDPGALTYIARQTGLGFEDIDRLLNKESGLLGVSGLSSDCRELEAAAADGHEGARLALDLFAHRLARHIGGLATSLRRFDALVFTGGIGENSAHVRELTLRRLGALGFQLDPEANARTIRGAEGVVGQGPGPVALVVATDEEWVIACDAATLAQRSNEAKEMVA